MKRELIEKIQNDPNYLLLVSRRKRFSWTLTIIMLVIYFGFVLMIAFEPQMLARPITQESFTSIGVVLGIGVIVSAFVLSGVYVWRANSEFDRLTHAIKRNVEECQ